MSEELKNVEGGAGEYDAAKELLTTTDFISEVAKSSKIHINAEFVEKADFPEGFDPKIHKIDSAGRPLLGSKNQFLLKKEAKKTSAQRLKEFLGGSEKKEPEIKKNAPLSDHEVEESERLFNETQEFHKASTVQREADLTASAESSAELFFFVGSMGLGLDFANQRNRYFDAVAGHFRRYEERTGKSIDLPPSAALLMGLGQVAYAISQQEPRCKERLDMVVENVRENVSVYVGGKIPFLGGVAKEKAEVQPEAKGDQNNDRV